MRKIARWVSIPALGLAALAATFLAAPAAAAELHLTGFVADTGNLFFRPLSAPLDVHVRAFTDAETMGGLAGTFSGKGEAALGEALFHQDLGRARLDGHTGFPIVLAQSSPAADGGTDYVLVFQRPVALFEVWRATRSLDYRYSVLELHVDRDGDGSGVFTAAARPYRAAPGRIEFEGLGRYPLRVLGVRRQKDA